MIFECKTELETQANLSDYDRQGDCAEAYLALIDFETLRDEIQAARVFF